MRAVRLFTIGCVILICSGHEAGQAQEGVVIDSTLGRGFYVTHASDPTQDFNKARAEYLYFDVAASAASIRRGANRMRESLADATDRSRQALQNSIIELESLARATEQRSVDSVKRLDEAFARANYALAQRHYVSALEAREQQAQARLGEELHRSAEYLQRARQQMGLELQEDEARMIGRTKALGSKLTTGIHATSDEITYDLRSLGQDLANLRDRLGGRSVSDNIPTRP